MTMPVDAMAQVFEAAPANDLPQGPNYNICPTNAVAALVGAQGDGGDPGDPGGAGRRLLSMRWGFLPRWYKSPSDGPLLINARAETLADKPAFREACRQRRCLIPADGFYEWTKDEAGRRLPWYIRPQAPGPVVFAGVWQAWEEPGSGARLTSCAIVTTHSNRALAHIHHRMPVTLGPQDWALWLGEAGHGAARLMRPGPEDRFEAYRVGAEVNSNRAEGAGLVAPLAA